ncbi:MAG TPA: hypothetical protein VL068_06260 [Microthrixaceae bacterium]|nr:hypothetical protein [Microthrixaceae bacterium]
MNLGLREMRRAWGRFVLLAASVGLLAFLILFQQAIQDGLITAFVGAIRNQNAPVIVYSLEGQRILQASLLTPDQVKSIASIEGVEKTARVQQSTYSVELDGSDVNDAAVIGSSSQGVFMPDKLSAGRYPRSRFEAVGSASDFRVGDKVVVTASPKGSASTLTVVGLAREVQLNVTATLFTDIETSEAVAHAYNPSTPGGFTNAVAIRPSKGTSADLLVDRINSSFPDVEALTRDAAADRSPGVAQVRQSFQIIFLLYALVVPLVTGLFFLILTLQKADSLTLLRAMGARASTLARSLLAQSLVVLAGGLLLAVAMFYPLSRLELGAIALRFDVGVVALWAGILVTLGLLSTLVSLRRVMRIDPVAASTGKAEI